MKRHVLRAECRGIVRFLFGGEVWDGGPTMGCASSKVPGNGGLRAFQDRRPTPLKNAWDRS